jgi:hypothetical protein
MQGTRRKFIGGAVLAALLPSMARAAAAEPNCGGELPLSQRNRRRALGYVDVSEDGRRQCGLCTYFAGTEGGCGACQMLSGSSVNARGACNSFVPAQR